MMHAQDARAKTNIARDQKNNAIRQAVESAIHNAVKDGHMNTKVDLLTYSNEEIDYIKDILTKSDYNVKIDSYTDFRDSWKILFISWE